MPRNSSGAPRRAIEEATQAATYGLDLSRGKTKTIGPEAQIYGVYNPAYAQSLGQSTGASGADIMRHGALALAADNEQKSYEAQLAAAQRAQQQLAETEGYYGLQEAVFSKIDKPLHGQYGVLTDANGRSRIQDDPVLSSAANAIRLDTDVAGNQGTRAEAIKNLADAGFGPAPTDVSAFMRSPLENPENAVQYGVYMNPGDVTARTNARTHEQDLELAEAKAKYRQMYGTDPDGDGIKWKMEIDPYGKPKWVIEGSPEQFEAEGYQLPPGVNPKAGAQGGGASATPAANAQPVANAKSIAESLFPGIRITDHKRDPNSALGKKNPNSWHTRSGAAIDSAAVPGMTFEQYVKKYEDAGYTVIEKKNEYTNPSKHATGPHWHVVLGGGPSTKPNAGNKVSVAGYGGGNSPAPQQKPVNHAAIAANAQRQGYQVAREGGVLVITNPKTGRVMRVGPNGEKL